MKKLNEIQSTMLPLPLSNVDTDQIMPKEFLKRVERSGYGEFLFYDWKKNKDGSKNIDFPLNKEIYKNAKVLITGENFGTGSSREHAPWGIQDWGFEAVISSKFGDIFKNNCLNIGLLALEIEENLIQKIISFINDDPKTKIYISIENKTIVCRDINIEFDLDVFSQHRLINGLDLIDITLEHKDSIDNFYSSRFNSLPHLT
mgnify:CR=1 FL=1|jgi:3-isopropylmalate/(R)-2-methylmalate dehydratase small subunit|tara:strand:+ start:4349 stop:4954 length:606 start_codon:yes stop_codon:yes gene_type:complete